MKELIPVKYGLYRIILAAVCFIFVFSLHFFAGFTETLSLLEQQIADNSGPDLIEQSVYDFVNSLKK